MLWMLAACTPTPTVIPPVLPTDPPGPVEAVRTELTTRDGVNLVADVYAGEPGASSVLLLHMTPAGGWNRSDWPAVFIDKLVERGWWVVALDRRGSGESDGVGEEAYLGEAGRYDAEAATLWLETAGAGSLAIIGASNGTTTTLDYTTWASNEGLPVPVGVGFMTGGSYTENQTSMDLLTVPVVFTYSTAERQWSEEQRGGAPASWVFYEYPDGAHGTLMFEAQPSVTDDLTTFLEGVL